MPLTLTLLSAAFPPERRTAALGLWSSIAGLGVALGPLLGGVLVKWLDWHWISGSTSRSDSRPRCSCPGA